MSLVKKGLLVFFVLVLFQIGLFGALYDQHVRLTANETQARNSLTANQILSNELRSAVCLLDLFRETTHPVVTEKMIRSSKAALRQLKALKELYKDEAGKLPIIDDARMRAEQCIGYLESAVAQSQKPEHDPASVDILFARVKKASSELMLDIDSLIGLMNDEQTATARAIENQQANRQMTFQLLGYGTICELVFLAVFFGWFKQDIESRFNRLIENSDLLVQGKPLLPLMASKDEIGAIDASLHQISKALKESQERERATIEHARDLICRVDTDLLIAQSNQAVLDLLDYKMHQFTGKTLREIVHKDDAEQMISQFRQNGTERELPFEARLVRRDGRIIDTLWSVRWSIRDHSFICVVHDITTQKQAERFRQEVVQMVSHDLKTPLFTVSSFLEMAESDLFGKVDQNGRQTITNAFQGCTQMLALIKDLLEIEKIKAGMLALEPREESLWAIMQTAGEQVRHLSRQHNVNWQLLEPDISVYADPDRLAQVLASLLHIAISSSPRETTVTVRSAKKSGFSQIDIIDGGSQPTVEATQSMFAGFRNFAAWRNGNLALELSVSQALIGLHGGTVKALRDGDSCRFIVRLPEGNSGVLTDDVTGL